MHEKEDKCVSTGGIGQKVTPHGLRVGIIKDWDSRWKQASEGIEDFNVREIRSYLSVIGKVRDWNYQDNRGMKNVPRKKPHHK